MSSAKSKLDGKLLPFRTQETEPMTTYKRHRPRVRPLGHVSRARARFGRDAAVLGAVALLAECRQRLLGARRRCRPSSGRWNGKAPCRSTCSTRRRRTSPSPRLHPKARQPPCGRTPPASSPMPRSLSNHLGLASSGIVVRTRHNVTSSCHPPDDAAFPHIPQHAAPARPAALTASTARMTSPGL